jgi:hypothetical protein
MEVISLSENCHFSKSPSKGQSYKKSYTRNFIHGIVNSTGAVKASAQLYKCLRFSVFPSSLVNWELQTGLAPRLTRKHLTKLERLARDKQYYWSLINYTSKKLKNIGPGCTCL